MILNDQQIKAIIVNNPNKDLVKKGTDYNKTMRLHLYGEGLKDAMGKIEGYETEELQKLRVTYARSNKDLFSRLGRPIDKVFSARGGSVYYNLPDSLDKQARALSLNIRNGFSIRKWIESFWKPHFLDDPFGLMFLEILPAPEAQLARQKGQSFVYPTYKSITSIYDYQTKGTSLEYVVFNVTKQDKKLNGFNEEDQIYRVVDDASDYWVKRQGEDITILSEFTFPNFFGQVPAVINSDIISPADETCFLSLYDDILEIAREFMVKGGIKITYEFLHAYPKYWQYVSACVACDGSGYNGGDKCSKCSGTGKNLAPKVSEMLALVTPQAGEPVFTPDVAGYVTPPKDYYDMSTAAMQMLEDLMHYTIWGAQTKLKSQAMQITGSGDKKTATEIMDDIKPQADRLQVISEMAEFRDKFIRDNMIRINFNQTSFPGTNVSYGRRYMIENPDEIWDKYAKARADGGAVSVLDDLLEEYYETKYQSDPLKLAIQQKLMKVEPFVHLTSDKVEMSGSITREDKSAKAYFGEWLSTLNDGMIIVMTPELLRENLMLYAAAKAAEVDKAQKDKATFEASLTPKNQMIA